MTDEVYKPDLGPDSDEYDNLEVPNDPVPVDEESTDENDEGGE